jgi:hypothetical protein
MDYDVVLWPIGVDLWRVEVDGVLFPDLVTCRDELFDFLGGVFFDV